MGDGGLAKQVRGLELARVRLLEMSMAGRFVKESLIIFGGTIFFLALCATVGISTSSPPSSPPAEAAIEPEDSSEAQPAGCHGSVEPCEEPDAPLTN